VGGGGEGVGVGVGGGGEGVGVGVGGGGEGVGVGVGGGPLQLSRSRLIFNSFSTF